MGEVFFKLIYRIGAHFMPNEYNFRIKHITLNNGNGKPHGKA